jgi:hypothetical protein
LAGECARVGDDRLLQLRIGFDGRKIGAQVGQVVLDRIFIFDINDARKKTTYKNVRAAEERELVKKTMQKTSHLFYTKTFFRDAAKTLKVKTRIVDEADLGVSFHCARNISFWSSMPCQVNLAHRVFAFASKWLAALRMSDSWRLTIRFFHQ